MEAGTDLVLEPRHYEILSSASLAEVAVHVLKHGDTFAVLDAHGDMTTVGNGEQGLFHDGTRHLSRMELWLRNMRPVLLSSAIRSDNALLTVHLTNPDLLDVDGRAVAHGMLHFFRAKLLWNGCCYEHLRVRNFSPEPVRLDLAFVYEADYVDIFEVRGNRRPQRGELLAPELEGSKVVLSYRGLDDVVRRTQISFAPEPVRASGSDARFEVYLEPHEQKDLYVTAACAEVGEPELYPFGDALKKKQVVARTLREDACRITTSSEQFNVWLDRSLDDLNMLLTEVPDGQYPYAGIPWYNTFFGRDGLLTAMLTLWINPDIARGVLSFLARTQADEHDPRRASDPGKILHEARGGEMAALGEIPFGRYYGTVDATPLFVQLAGAYERHTGDLAFVESIWPNIERALAWADEYGDVDGDGFVEYVADEQGLTQQGWKDSEDSVFYEDGILAEGPIALCEVQGYVYAAKREAARLADLLGRGEMALRLRAEATTLRERFEEAFWSDDLGMYALALDGAKRQCKVLTSNAGHALFAGIAGEERARQISQRLFEPDMFSGWGIRTLSAKERRYNPMSYHNGSIWPHDNALIARGLGEYRCHKAVHRLMKAFLDASLYDKQQRLPELFCGFSRRTDEGPIPYPVACSPQAWASVVVFGLLQASLGLSIDAARGEVVLKDPTLPAFLSEVRIQNLRVGSASVDLVLQRYRRSVGVEVTRRSGSARVVTEK